MMDDPVGTTQDREVRDDLRSALSRAEARRVELRQLIAEGQPRNREQRRHWDRCKGETDRKADHLDEANERLIATLVKKIETIESRLKGASNGRAEAEHAED